MNAFIGMLVLNIAFVVKMVFGNSDWVGDLWNVDQRKKEKKRKKMEIRE